MLWAAWECQCQCSKFSFRHLPERWPCVWRMRRQGRGWKLLFAGPGHLWVLVPLEGETLHGACRPQLEAVDPGTGRCKGARLFRVDHRLSSPSGWGLPLWAWQWASRSCAQFVWAFAANAGTFLAVTTTIFFGTLTAVLFDSTWPSSPCALFLDSSNSCQLIGSLFGWAVTNAGPWHVEEEFGPRRLRVHAAARICGLSRLEPGRRACGLGCPSCSGRGWQHRGAAKPMPGFLEQGRRRSRCVSCALRQAWAAHQLGASKFFCEHDHWTLGCVCLQPESRGVTVLPGSARPKTTASQEQVIGSCCVFIRPSSRQDFARYCLNACMHPRV